MNDSGERVPAASSFDVTHMRRGKHSVLLYLPDTYAAPIGLVIAHWGHFEMTFDTCLEAFVAGEAAEGIERDLRPDWHRTPFKYRAAHFKAICNEWLSSWRKDEAVRLVYLTNAALHLHSRRNLIAHGTYGYVLPPHSSDATKCYVKDRSGNRRFDFDLKVLKKLYHDISHLTADLVLIVRSFGEVSGPVALIADDEILRIYRETDHPWNPNPKRRGSSTAEEPPRHSEA